MQSMTSMLMYVNVFSTNKDVGQNFLYNYVTVNILPRSSGSRGVGSRRDPGQPRVCHADLSESRPHARAYNVSSDDVMKAVKDQSVIGLARTPRPGHGQNVANDRVRS